MASKTAAMVLGFAIAVTVGMVFFGPLATAVSDNTGDQDVTNETFTADFDDAHDLQGYDVYDSETVWVANGSNTFEQATEGTDYTFDYASGEITMQNTSLVDAGDTVKVEYTYEASDPLASTVIGFIPVIFGTLLFAKVAFAAQDVM